MKAWLKATSKYGTDTSKTGPSTSDLKTAQLFAAGDTRPFVGAALPRLVLRRVTWQSGTWRPHRFDSQHHSRRVLDQIAVVAHHLLERQHRRGAVVHALERADPQPLRQQSASMSIVLVDQFLFPRTLQTTTRSAIGCSRSCSHCACVPSSNATCTRGPWPRTRPTIAFASVGTVAFITIAPRLVPRTSPRSLPGARPTRDNESPVVSWQPLLPFVWSSTTPNLQEGACFQHALV